MNIIIAGDGEVGVHLAKSLTELDHNITVVDPHSELLKRLESENDLLTITGDATSPQVLRDANVGDCDLFLSVLHDESVNLVSCILAKKLKAKKTVARITNAELLAPKHRDMFRELGVDEMVCPERIAAKEITNLLNNTVATEFFDFSGGLLTMYVIRLDAGSPVVGHDVRGLTQMHPELQVRVVALLRNGFTLIPHSDTVLQSGDLAYIIGRANQLENINAAVGKHGVTIKNTMIAGGGRIGRYAALTLQDRMRITLIEADRQRAEELSALLDGPLIIHGDATDIELLKEEGLERADAFIGVTDSSETNVLTCLHAKRLGVKRTIALVENTGFIDISQDIGIDTIINKKLITAGRIYKFTLSNKVRFIKYMSGTNAEVLEYIVAPDTAITKHMLKDMNFPKNAIIGGVIRGNESYIAVGETHIQAYDRVAVFALPEAVKEVDKFFK